MSVCRKSPMIRFGTIVADRVFIKDGLFYRYDDNICDTNPTIRFNEGTNTWQFSNDGETFFDFGSSSGSSVSGSDASTKYAEITEFISADTNHTLPNGANYTKTVSGHKLDVFLNGQLLTPVIAGSTGDYTETSTTTIKFHFNIPAGTLLTYIIK